MGNKIEVSIAQGLDVHNIFKDVSNFVKDVPNFVEDVSNFIKDVRRVPKFVLRWGMTSNHHLRSLKNNMDHEKINKGLDSLRIGCTKIS